MVAISHIFTYSATLLMSESQDQNTQEHHVVIHDDNGDELKLRVESNGTIPAETIQSAVDTAVKQVKKKYERYMLIAMVASVITAYVLEAVGDIIVAVYWER